MLMTARSRSRELSRSSKLSFPIVLEAQLALTEQHALHQGAQNNDNEIVTLI